MVLSAIETIVAGIVLPGLKFVSNKKASNQELCYEELGRGEDSHFYIIVSRPCPKWRKRLENTGYHHQNSKLIQPLVTHAKKNERFLTRNLLITRELLGECTHVGKLERNKQQFTTPCKVSRAGS